MDRELLEERLANNWTNGADVRGLMSEIERLQRDLETAQAALTKAGKDKSDSEEQMATLQRENAELRKEVRKFVDVANQNATERNGAVAKLASAEAALNKIINIPLGPDRGSAQSQIDCAAACDPEIHSGTPCLYETRIPMTMLASEVGQYGAAAVIEDRHLSCTEGYLETATTRFSEWLDDRDRAALRKGSDWLDKHYGYEIAVAFIGEFSLDPKPKGK